MAEQLAAVEVGLWCRTHSQGGIFTQQRKCTKGQEATSPSSSSTLSSSEGETPTDSSRGTTTTTTSSSLLLLLTPQPLSTLQYTRSRSRVLGGKNQYGSRSVHEHTHALITLRRDFFFSFATFLPPKVFLQFQSWNDDTAICLLPWDFTRFEWEWIRIILRNEWLN